MEPCLSLDSCWNFVTLLSLYPSSSHCPYDSCHARTSFRLWNRSEESSELCELGECSRLDELVSHDEAIQYCWMCKIWLLDFKKSWTTTELITARVKGHHSNSNLIITFVRLTLVQNRENRRRVILLKSVPGWSWSWLHSILQEFRSSSDRIRIKLVFSTTGQLVLHT